LTRGGGGGKSYNIKDGCKNPHNSRDLRGSFECPARETFPKPGGVNSWGKKEQKGKDRNLSPDLREE